MVKFVVRRLAAAIPMLLIVSMIMFVVMELLPGDPAVAIAGQDASREVIEQTRERLGLDDPLPVRYARWLGDAVRGDLGESLTTSRQPVVSAVKSRLPVTLSLAAFALVFSVMVSIPLGIVAALRPKSWVDRAVTSLASLGMAIPGFVAALILVLLFAVEWRWFPATGYVSIADGGIVEWARHLVLPALALSTTAVGHFTRQTRAAFSDVFREDYIRTARAKGLSPRTVLAKHAAKSAAIPIITVVGLTAGRLVGGAVTIEIVFALPGFGSLIVNAVSARDVPMIQGAVLVTAIAVTFANLLVDLSYGILNPKVRE